MLIALALILLAVAFAGFWSQRKALQPATQSIITSGFMLTFMFVVFGAWV